MKTSDKLVLIDLLDTITRIEENLQGLGFGDFAGDRKLRIVTGRSFSAFFEVLDSISPEMKNKFTDIPWDSLSGIRNKIIAHEYGIDDEEIWHFARHELKKLEKVIRAELKN